MSSSVEPIRLYQANAWAALWFADQLRRLPARGARRYLRKHGISHAGPSEPWYLGLAPFDWSELRNRLTERGFTDEELLAAGLIRYSRDGRPIDRFRDRLMFPILDEHERVVGFCGRDLTGMANTPKWLNTPETPIFQKRNVLYGLGQHVLRGRREESGSKPLAVVVEGPADAIAVQRVADETSGPGRAPVVAVAPCGTNLTRGHLEELRKHLPDANLAIAFDGDAAGRRAFDRTYPVLRDWPGRRYGIELPQGVDPADLVARGGPERTRAELAARTKPAARMALSRRLAALKGAGHITRPQDWPTDRLLAYESIGRYFVDDPNDTEELARIAARELGISDGEVVRGVVEQVFPDAGPPELSAEESGARRASRGGGALEKVRQAKAAIESRIRANKQVDCSQVDDRTTASQRSAPCHTRRP